MNTAENSGDRGRVIGLQERRLGRTVLPSRRSWRPITLPRSPEFSAVFMILFRSCVGAYDAPDIDPQIAMRLLYSLKKFATLLPNGTMRFLLIDVEIK